MPSNTHNPQAVPVAWAKVRTPSGHASYAPVRVPLRGVRAGRTLAFVVPTIGPMPRHG